MPFRNPDLALDLGTSVARVGTGRSPAFLECPARLGSNAAVREGVVIDTAAATGILQPLFRRFVRLGHWGLRVLACAPSDTSTTERERLEIALHGAGAQSVFIAPEPLAAAIGAGMDVSAPEASMVLDLGEGVADCAVISQGQIIASKAIRGGCNAWRESIVQAVLEAAEVRIDDSEAERLMRHVGIETKGARTTAELLPTLGSKDGSTLARRHFVPARVIAAAIARAIEHPMTRIAEFIESRAPRQIAQIVESGIAVTGGGALVPGVAANVCERFGLPIRVAPSPLSCVIRGAQQMLEVAAQARLWR